MAPTRSRQRPCAARPRPDPSSASGTRSIDDQLERFIEIDPEDVWRRIEAEPGDLSHLVDAATRIAGVDGDPNPREQDLITQIQQRCGPRGA